VRGKMRYRPQPRIESQQRAVPRYGRECSDATRHRLRRCAAERDDMRCHTMLRHIDMLICARGALYRARRVRRSEMLFATRRALRYARERACARRVASDIATRKRLAPQRPCQIYFARKC